MTSHPRPLRSSPPRRALQERSESDINEIVSPILRGNADSDTPIYSTSPFPTLPSQILSPKNRRSGLVFEDDYDVSDEANSKEQALREPLLETKDKSKESSDPTTNSHVTRPHDSLRRASTEPSYGTDTDQDPLSVLPLRIHRDQELFDEDELPPRESDEIIELPSVPLRGSYSDKPSTPDSSSSSIPRFHGSASGETIGLKSSNDSLPSNESSGTVIITRPGESSTRRTSYSAFPRSISSNYGLSSSPIASSTKSSTDSLAPAALTYPEGRRLSPLPSEATIDRSPPLQYPTIRAPSASGSWAEIAVSVPRRSPRLNDRNVSPRWNPHLSTVPSELIEERISGGSRPGSPPRVPSHTALMSEEPSEGKPDPTLLQPPLIRQRDNTTSTIRIVTDEDANMSSTNLPTLRTRGSAFFSILSRDSSRDDRPNGIPGSRGSWFQGIPAWARTYYGRGRDLQTPSSGAPGTASGVPESRPPTSAPKTSPFKGISRPRSRPHGVDATRPNRDSMEILPVEEPAEDRSAEPRIGPRRRVTETWSPHLWHDKRASTRVSIFKAPSLVELAHGFSLDRRSAQIALFAVGFIFPIAWMVASFLPLPPKPILNGEEAFRRFSTSRRMDLEKAMGNIDMARYENARWWRRINRTMSFVGLVIIAAIIALAVIATKSKN